MQDQSNQPTPQPTPEDTAQNASAPASQEAAKGQQMSGWKQKMQALLKKCTILLAIAGALFLIAGVPIIINELYKRPGYVTMWSAADMLGYYGTILGAVATIGALAGTIWFTKKQVQRESYLHREKERWNQIESMFSYILDIINPLKVVKETTGISQNERRIQVAKNQLLYMTEINRLYIELSANDASKVKELLASIQRCTDEINKSMEKLAKNGDQATTKQVEEKLTYIYTGIYSLLVYKKIELFSQIYTDIQKEADNILSPWRKH